MINPNDLNYFRKIILKWFAVNKRDFPWRKEDISNYRLILSEIFLQRTRAENVAKFYDQFFYKYPDWGTLTHASIAELEIILKPLGLYKHRAKRIHKIAKEYEIRNGRLPKNRNELGESNLASLYISNAFELFILKKKAALLDVNMTRVLSRYFGLKCKGDVRHDNEMQEFAFKIVNSNKCREINWGILDFAALVCKSSKPKCSDCELMSNCMYFQKVKLNNG